MLLNGAFAVGALEAVVVCHAVSHELIHGVHRLLACLALLLVRPAERHLLLLFLLLIL
ncbi:hypothetical protein DsansV1_C07g0077461 [Dioscorea sansibarensis]